MKKIVKDQNGEKKTVFVVDFKNPLEIYGVRKKSVQKKDGSWTELKEVSTNYGKCVVSQSFYDALVTGKPIEDDKLYLSLSYIGINGTGDNAFQEF